MESIKSALNSIWSNKIRSLLTVLGIVIGVSSVTILVSLGQGLKNDVSGLIRGFGTNVLAVIGGKIEPGQNMNSVNPASLVSGEILTIKDVNAIGKISDIKEVAPMALLPGNIKYQDKISAPMLFGTYPNLLKSFDVLKLKDGAMFKTNDDGYVIVLGPVVKTELFGDADAVGKFVEINKKEFKVIGVFGQATGSSLVSNEYDRMSVVPFATAIAMNDGKVKINRIIVRADDNADVKAVKEEVKKVMLKEHDGEENFTVFTQDDFINLFDQFLSLATTLVSAIASISLLVGGIGIMNIMLVTVTERTKEIGLRKAVGATKKNIASQFLVEAIMVTLVGGMLGLLISFGVAAIVAAKTPLTPSITPNVIIMAIGISTVIGVIFGLWPALRAANKDPIEALRYE